MWGRIAFQMLKHAACRWTNVFSNGTAMTSCGTLRGWSQPSQLPPSPGLRAREYQVESQSDREPDPPHGSSVRMAGGYTEFNDANSDAHKMMVVPRRTCPIGAPCLLATGHVDAALEVRAVVDGNSRGCDVSFD